MSALLKMTFARTSAVALTGLIMVGVAGCGSSSTPASANPAAANPAAAKSPSATAPTAESLVHQVTLRDSDLKNGYTMKLIPGGDQVAGQVTLDNCGYDFTTESHRVARRQVGMLNAMGKDAGLSNEVVAYDSVAAATKALAELRTSVSHCPKNVFVKGSVAAAPAVRYDAIVATTDARLPVRDNAVVTSTVTAKGSTKRLYLISVFQRQGTVLDGTYVWSTSKPTALDVTTMVGLAAVSGKRLAST